MNFPHPKPILGMIHLNALPGSPGYDHSIEKVWEKALADATALIEGGVDGLVIENYFDLPFYPDSVPPVTVAHFTVVAKKN